MGILVGIIWLVVVVWNGVAIARRQRRSGGMTDYGHPIEDKFLRLGSPIAVIAAMLTTFWWLGPKVPEKHSPGGHLLVLAFLALAAGITSVANGILRVGKKKG